MTEYTDKVEAVKLRQELDIYAKSVSYIHASNGIVETKYNNGDIRYEFTRGPKEGRTEWHRENCSEESLLDKMRRAMTDRRNK
jgi:hypothetical protein